MTRTPRRPVVAIVAVATITAGCSGTGSGSGDKGEAAKPTYAMAGKVAWTQGPAAVETTDPAKRQAWMTTDLLVYIDRRSGLVRALDKSTGAQRWVYQLPAKIDSDVSLDAACGASSEAVGGAVAITYQRGAPERFGPCTGLVMLDLSTGKPRWSKKEHTPVGAVVEVGAGLVITNPATPVSAGSSVIHRTLVTFDAATGRRRWTVDPIKLGRNCRNNLSGPGRRLIAADARAVVTTFDCQGGQQIWTFDPRTGRPKPGAVFENTVDGLSFVGLEAPLVLTDGSATYVLSEDGSRVKYHLRGVPQTDVELRSSPRIFRWKSSLIGADLRYGTVQAWDLRSGDPVWHRDLEKQQPDRSPAAPFIADVGDDGVVLVLGGIAEEVRIAKLDPATGDQTDLSPVLKTDLFNEADGLWWFWDGKRVIGVHDNDQTLTVKDPKPVFAVE